MSHYDYQASKLIAMEDHPFAALIMAAMRQADTGNMTKLRRAWPGVARELQARYDTPGGFLLGACCGHDWPGHCEHPRHEAAGDPR